MATLIDNPNFTNDEVYKILSTDAVEGAADGASFGGIGISNEPHQQLANRTRYLKNRQDTNIINIAALQAFAGKFKSRMAMPGYLQIDALDDVRGDLQPMLNFGFYSFTSPQLRGVDLENQQFNVTFNKAFPILCLGAWAIFASNRIGSGALWSCVLVLETLSNSLSKTGCSFFSDFNAQSTDARIYVANPSTGATGFTGFYWFALGF